MDLLKHFEIPEEIKDNALIRQALLPLRVCGLAIYTNDKHKVLHFLRGLAFIVISLSTTILQLYAIQQSPSYDLNKIMISVACVIIYLSSNCQILKLLTNFKGILNLVSYMAENLNQLQNCKGHAERRLFMDFSFYSKFVLNFCIGNIVVGFTMVFAGCLVTMVHRPEIFEAGYVLDYEHTPILLLFFTFKNITDNLMLAYILPFIACFVHSFCIVAWVLIITHLLLFAIYLLKFLNLKFENLGDIPPTDLTKQMISLIQMQIATKRFIERLNNFISTIIFIDFMLYSICICFVLYYFAESNFERSSNTFLMVMMLLFVSFTQLLYHAAATEICHQWSTLSTSFYLSTWYEFPLSVKKMGLLMMTYSTRPIEMRAVFIQMHLTTFVSIMQGAYGYLTMLRNMNHT